jgi:site-specific recombinase XerD
MKLNMLIQKFLLAYEGVYSPQTVQWYRNRFKPLNELAHKALLEITIDDLRSCYVVLSRKQVLYDKHPHDGRQPQHKPYSKYTLHSYARAWKRLFRWGVKERHLEINPAQKLKLPQLPDPEIKVLSRKGLLKLIYASRRSNNPERDEAILRFLADSGAQVAWLPVGMKIICSKSSLVSVHLSEYKMRLP